MNIIKNLNQYNSNDIHFCEPIKNNIMLNGNFIRILYSTTYFTMNGIYLYVPLLETTIEKYYQKYKCSFDIINNIGVLEQISNIEHTLLEKIKYYMKNKSPSYKINEQLNQGSFKLFATGLIKQQKASFLLKISGIWENESSYGITYKFTRIDSI
jgi:hypothetical protein